MSQSNSMLLLSQDPPAEHTAIVKVVLCRKVADTELQAGHIMAPLTLLVVAWALRRMVRC